MLDMRHEEALEAAPKCETAKAASEVLQKGPWDIERAIGTRTGVGKSLPLLTQSSELDMSPFT